jgi:flavin reductase (DIM6/NTAB) family NADH-FMN oxidoreductase RutF
MAVDNSTFRTAMNRWASGVAIVTTQCGQTRAGLTVSSFTSLSLNPPLVLVCIDCTSRSLALIRESGRFAVNILADSQQDIARRFAARDSDDRFSVGVWRTAGTGVPLLDNALGSFDCALVTMHNGGDHKIVIGLVQSTQSTATGSEPLLYYHRGYRQLYVDEPQPNVCVEHQRSIHMEIA